MTDYDKPLPEITDENRPFWEGTRSRELRMQRCEGCGRIRYPIAIVCPDCLDDRCEWVALVGGGEIHSLVVFHQVYNKAFAQDVPYNVAIIQLDEGPRMVSNIVHEGMMAARVGDRVTVVFEDVTPEIALPRFALES